MDDLSISFVFTGIADLRTEDVWPDGSGPAHPTAADVVAQMEQEGSKLDVLRRWGISPALDVHVIVDGDTADITTAWEEPIESEEA